MPSPSVSACEGFGFSGQLSSQPAVAPPVHGRSPAVPDPSPSSATPSPSRSGSQTSPSPSPSRSAWSGLSADGQLSQTSPRESPSASDCDGLAKPGQLSAASSVPSPSRSSVAAGQVNGCPTGAPVESRPSALSAEPAQELDTR